MKICLSKLCTGCGACSNVCPKKCIDIYYDKDGFLRPRIDESKCIGCEMCVRTCPSNKEVRTNEIQNVYIVSSKDQEILKTSSSGGVFSELSRNILERGGVVFGAKFSEKCDSVQHCYIEEYQEIVDLRGSKYIQSEMLDNFQKVKYILNDNREVLFVGTPCQVAGLKTYLGKEYEKLICVDFICHGVASTKAFNEYVSSLNLKSKIKSICFRNKEHGYEYKNNLFKIVCEDGTTYEEPWLASTLGFAFANNLLSRPSCKNCKYATTSRVSDITLSDYFGEKSDDEQKKRGVSLVLTNTKKGNDTLYRIVEQLKIQDESIEQAILLQKHLSAPAIPHKNRNRVFRRLGKWSWKRISETFFTSYKPARTVKSIFRKLKIPC